VLTTYLPFCCCCCCLFKAISVLFVPNCILPSHFSSEVLFHVWWEKNTSLFPSLNFSYCIFPFLIMGMRVNYVVSFGYFYRFPLLLNCYLPFLCRNY
jgi:hypothetical protein